MPRKDLKVAQKVRERIKKWDDNWKFNRTQYNEYQDFIMGDMWTDEESRLFERYNKLPLTFNKLSPLANYLIGEQRQNTPALEVVPDESAPLEAVEVREAIIKSIAFDSHSKVAYQYAFQSAIIGGYGAFGLRTEYENEYSFDQRIVVYPIKNPTLCYWDVSAESPCKTDGMYAGYRTRVSRTKFREMYGERIERMIPSSSYEDDTNLMSFDDEETITVIEDYERSYDRVKMYELSNGKTMDQKLFDELQVVEVDGEEVLWDDEIVTVVNTRTAHRYKVTHRKVAGDYVLEKNDFASEQLPIVFVDQNSYYDKNGKQFCRPFFKDARDSQKYLNYLGTQSAYMMKISRYDQFIASKANVKSADTQAIWRDPSTVQGALFYDESPNGNKPERLVPPELSQSLLTQYERTLRDIQSSTGIYDTQIGQQGNEMSGAAVDARTRRGANNTYVAYDSINRAICAAGCIIEEMIPALYDAERILMIELSDKIVQPVPINQPVDEYGTQIRNDMTKGRYKVRLRPGPSYEGQKTVALESLQMVLQSNPGLFNMIADLYCENLPLANNIELRNRLKTLVPPEIIEAGKTGKSPPPPPPAPDPEIQLKMQEQQLKEQSMQLEMKKAEQSAAEKMAELNMKQRELESRQDHDRQRVAMEWQQIEAQKLEAAANLEEQVMRYKAEMERIGADIDIAHANNLSKLLIHSDKQSKPPT
jgi:hypothetical protein